MGSGSKRNISAGFRYQFPEFRLGFRFWGTYPNTSLLFTGFSFIFLAEAFYFFTIRWYEEFTKKLQPKPTISSTAEGWMKSHSDPEIK